MLHISYNVEIMKLTLEDLGFGSSDDAFLSLKIIFIDNNFYL